MEQDDVPDYLIEPTTFDAAQRWLTRKISLPTALSAREIANQWPAGARNQAFFSARVASANILESLRAEVHAIAAGETNYADARARISEFLAKEGYGVPAPQTQGDRDLGDIASTRRLDLVLRQNVAMAHAVGQRQVSEHPYVAERYPCYRYVANTSRHENLDGTILPKTDPFWATYFPPWDYNCQCMAIDSDEEPNSRSVGYAATNEGGQVVALDLRGRLFQMLPPESGFTFRSAPQEAFREFDLSAIDSPEIRASVEAELYARLQAEPPPAAPLENLGAVQKKSGSVPD